MGAAKAGTLTFIVGGAEEGFTKAKPILECMGKNVVHCGSNGMGQVSAENTLTQLECEGDGWMHGGLVYTHLQTAKLN